MCSSWDLQKAISPCYELIIYKPNKPHIQSFVGLAYKLSSLIKNNGFKSGICILCSGWNVHAYVLKKKSAIWSLQKAVLVAPIYIVTTGKLKYRTYGHFWRPSETLLVYRAKICVFVFVFGSMLVLRVCSTVWVILV